MQAWESFLERLKKQIGEEPVFKWLYPLKVIHFDACNVYLEAQTSFEVDWFEEHIRPIAKKELLNNNHRPIKVHITCAEQVCLTEKKELFNNPDAEFTLEKDLLIPEYNQDTFFFQESNLLISKVIEGLPEISFTPLVLYGPHAAGKTHLLQILTKILQKFEKQALYVRAETFTGNLVRSIRSGKMQEFRKMYRHVDALIFDDIQHLAKKAATQEEFFHTFNALQTEGKPIILSSSVIPSMLEHIEPRLISRFEWGLSIPILPLEKQHFSKLLQLRSIQFDFSIPQATIDYLIETFSGIHSLDQAFKALMLRSLKLTPSKITPTTAKQLLNDLIIAEQKSVLDPSKILSCVANFYSIDPQEIMGKSQTQECALPRQMAMFFCRHDLKMAFTKIGDYFKRDHSTVISSVRSIEEKMKSQDQEIHLALLSIRKNFQTTTKS